MKVVWDEKLFGREIVGVGVMFGMRGNVRDENEIWDE
jgi:hypothetical protein